MPLIQLGGRRKGFEIRGWMQVDDQDGDLARHAWQAHNNGYAFRHESCEDGRKKAILAHREIAERVLRRTLVPGEEIDHINHDKRDNRRENLRVVTRAQNAQHRNGPDASNTTGHRGVTRKRGRFQASVWHKGQRHGAGTFNTATEAAEAAKALRKRLGFLGE